MVCIAKLLNGNECMKYSIAEIKKKRLRALWAYLW